MDNKPFTSEEVLAEINSHYGIVPNIFKKLALSKVTLKSYFDIVNNLNYAELSDLERQIVYLTICQFDRCDYCLKSHLFVAKSLGLSEEEATLIKEYNLPNTRKYLALANITILLLKSRGKISHEQAAFFFEQGFTEQTLYEIITIIAMKCISNFVENLSSIKLDDVLINN